MSIFGAIARSARLAVSLPAKALRTIALAIQNAITVSYEALFRSIRFGWDLIVSLARGASWLRRRTSDLFFWLFSASAVVSLFLLPWAMARDPLNISRFIPFSYQAYFFYVRMFLALFFALSCALFVLEIRKEFIKPKVEGQPVTVTFAEGFFRFLSDVSSWALFFCPDHLFGCVQVGYSDRPK